APMRTVPLIARIWPAPVTRSTSIEPDPTVTSTAPAERTCVEPLFVLTRHRPSLSSTSTEPLIVRMSADATCSARRLPLIVVNRTSPTRPRTRRDPERVPTTRSIPSGQRTTTELEFLFTMLADDPSITTVPPSTATPSRASPMTRIEPELVLTRTSTRPPVVTPSDDIPPALSRRTRYRRAVPSVTSAYHVRNTAT